MHFNEKKKQEKTEPTVENTVNRCDVFESKNEKQKHGTYFACKFDSHLKVN